MANNRRKTIALALAFVGVAGLSVASASTLNLTGGTVQAGVQDLTDCQTGAVTVGFGAPSYNTASDRYEVSSVSLTGVAATCAGKNVRVRVLDDANGEIGSEGTFAIPASFTGGPVTLTVGAVSAAAAEKVAVVISN